MASGAGELSRSKARNIVIFSDGTGQRGGVFFDEPRTNVYKLYRATRVSPDSTMQQLAIAGGQDLGKGFGRGEPVNQTFGSLGATRRSPRATAMVRAFISS